MKVLMFGWEFPPFNSGGLGTACHGLTKSMTKKGVRVTFVIPKAKAMADSHVDMVVANNVYVDDIETKHVDSILLPYISSTQYSEHLSRLNALRQRDGPSDDVDLYGTDLFREVQRYAEQARLIALHKDFDVIHAHDWMTYRAGIEARELTGKPLVVHVHATEFDRTGGHPDQRVYDREREGMHAADRIIAVSNYTRSMIIQHYGVPPEKIEVVHNGVELKDPAPHEDFPIRRHEKVVLFLGRLTLQKGPDYFLYAAHRVLQGMPDTKFVVAGKGDMESMLISKAAEMGIADRMLFTGFLRGADIDRAYRMADLYVMPSVSEPFGITPLEAMRNNTPVLISKQSGVSEVISHCLKADFWDIEDMAAKMSAVLKYSPLKSSLARNGFDEVNRISWDDAASRCIDVYNRVRCA